MTLEASHNSENKIAVFSPHSHAWDLSERCYRPSGIALLCNLGLNLTSGMLGSVIPLLVSIMLCRGIAGDFQIPDTEETPAKDDTFQAGRVHPHTLTDREKTTKKMRSVVQSIDKDSDGKITVQELAALIGNSMKAFYKQEADRNMKELDANKDGQVTWDEYVKTAGSRGAQLTSQQTKRDRRRFNHADLNEDKRLSRDELVLIYHPEESPRMFAVIVEEFLEFVDKDKDGFLSFQEYQEKAVEPGNTNFKAAQESFQRLDGDHDGKLDIEEMKQWLGALNTASQSKHQAERLVQMADDDEDGVLTWEEILKHKTLFTAGSKGTTFQQKVKDEL